jgi:excisionase family DNA binding protein
VALRVPDEAAKAIGVGRSFFYEHVLPDIRTVRVGRVRIVRVSELDRWLERNEARGLE